MLMITDPKQLFGPEYEGATQEAVAVLSVSNDPVDIVYQHGPMQMSLLPVGGYLIRYLEGSYAVASDPPAQVVGGKFGLKVRWKSSISTQWAEIPFPCESAEERQFVGSPQFHLEITRPHRIQLVPPPNSYGSVKVRVLRYVSPVMRDAGKETEQEVVG